MFSGSSNIFLIQLFCFFFKERELFFVGVEKLKHSTSVYANGNLASRKAWCLQTSKSGGRRVQVPFMHCWYHDLLFRIILYRKTISCDQAQIKSDLNLCDAKYQRMKTILFLMQSVEQLATSKSNQRIAGSSHFVVNLSAKSHLLH